MTPEEKREFEEMKRKIKVLEDYKRQKETQQISLPLDLPSQNIINNL